MGSIKSFYLRECASSSNRRVPYSARVCPFLICFSKIIGITLDELVGNLEPSYASTALDNALIAEISKMDDSEKEKLLKTIKIWK